MAGINNFGVGGVNVHILVEPNYKTEAKDNLKIAEEIPRIVNICGRTEEAVRHVMDFIENNPNKVTKEFLELLSDTMKYKPTINSSGLPFRGKQIYHFESTNTYFNMIKVQWLLRKRVKIWKELNTLIRDK